ncbi:TetR/AcrR family transcriptional regulator [Photobacterium gaetbulicola]|uniref:TetR family transcriptional regulator n=1 Tax=Photobacterium gaetbulicola Gung47 TaxID=658445 RepID=A0A0C5W327_9GAMM|nr:TetR/AcrR family transcriptional regulator [Photobacterium gaetbulicola]AJR05741.1 TetR family transcriptional regulator [Photobacterium gaetbulicola Gung47]PSU14707.1 TetR/AcrR family transcriptional regulator [Photobacterium gaetbulicola]
MSRSEQKRLAIITAAKQEFIANGFLAANMNNICTAAEVSKRTLYRHFESKELLFEAVLTEIREKSVVEEHYQFDENKSLDEQLRLITQHELKNIYQVYGIELSRTILMEFFRQPELAKSITQRLYHTHAVSQWFEQALAAKKLFAQDVQTITSIYISLLQGQLFWPQVLDLMPLPEGDELEHKIDMIVTTIVRTFSEP